jgi:O-antigen/teichoic acid export membrane protein
MYSIDILFARDFFSAEVAGRYAFVSMIGKVIIFVSFAIGKALLPISSEDFEKGKDTELLFRKALILVCIISGIILAFYGIIPKTIIWLISLGSTQYVSSSALLFPLGLSYTLLSITNVVILYKVSINKMGRSWIFLIFSAIQALAWILFHGTVLEFAYSFVFVNAIMFLYSIFFIKR